MLLIIIGIAFIWWIIGSLALIFDWKSDLSLEPDHLLVCLLCGLILGPSAWVFIGIKRIIRSRAVKFKL